MWKNINFENCLSYIDARTRAEAYAESHYPADINCQQPSNILIGDKIDSSANPSITISWLCGAGGRTVASTLMEYLQSHTASSRKWAIFDSNLIERVQEDHQLSKRIVESVPEDRKSILAKMVEKIHVLHPSIPSIVKQTVETIWNLAGGGYVILVGRAANVITEKMDAVLHVRLVGSLEKRVARIEEIYDMSRPDAREYIRAQDAAERHYMRAYFGRDIDDPLQYNFLINTDKISYDMTAKLIGDVIINRFKAAQSMEPKAP